MVRRRHNYSCPPIPIYLCMLTDAPFEGLAVDHPRLELKVFADPNNQEFIEVSRALYLRTCMRFLGRDGFDFHEVVTEPPIRTLGGRLVALDSVLDLSIDLTQLTPDLQVAASERFV